jgi:hypothetical protein
MNLRSRIFLLSILTVSTYALAGDKALNGGDANEIRFKEVSSNIAQWIQVGNADSLTMPKGVTLQRYKEAMSSIADRFVVSFTDDPVIVHGVEKVCLNSGADSSSAPQVTCNRTAFASLADSNTDGLYQLVHHELAGLAGLENNNGPTSDYAISSQLSAYLKEEVIKRLPILPQATVFIPPQSTPGWSVVSTEAANGAKKISIAQNYACAQIDALTICWDIITGQTLMRSTEPFTEIRVTQGAIFCGLLADGVKCWRLLVGDEIDMRALSRGLNKPHQLLIGNAKCVMVADRQNPRPHVWACQDSGGSQYETSLIQLQTQGGGASVLSLASLSNVDFACAQSGQGLLCTDTYRIHQSFRHATIFESPATASRVKLALWMESDPYHTRRGVCRAEVAFEDTSALRSQLNCMHGGKGETQWSSKSASQFDGEVMQLSMQPSNACAIVVSNGLSTVRCFKQVNGLPEVDQKTLVALHLDGIKEPQEIVSNGHGFCVLTSSGVRCGGDIAVPKEISVSN